MRIVNMTTYNAGLQMYGSKKPLIPPVDPVHKATKRKNIKERLKKLVDSKDFLDKKTVEFLERNGYINTNI